MATSTYTGAVYGIGVYGTAVYDQSNVTIVPDGVLGDILLDGITIIADAQHVIVAPTELDINDDVGTVTIAADANTSVTGVQATGSVNSTLSFILGHTETVTGVQATGNTTAPTVVAKANVEPPSASVDGIIGDVVIAADSNYAVTGVEGTMQIGTITQKTVNRVPVAGVEATASAGSLTIVGNATLTVTGVFASGVEGFVNATAAAVAVVNGVSVTASVGTVQTAENARPTFTGVSGTARLGAITVVNTSFDYIAVREQYDRTRTVYIARRSSSNDRTVYIAA